MDGASETRRVFSDYASTGMAARRAARPSRRPHVARRHRGRGARGQGKGRGRTAGGMELPPCL